MSDAITILPGATLGLMGGGQLGRFFAQAASDMGYHVLVIDPDPQCPASEVARHSIASLYTDKAALKQMSLSADAVTTEMENVPADALRTLAGNGLVTAPGPSAVAVTQDRIKEKTFLARQARVPVVAHLPVTGETAFDAIDPALFPGLLKTARLGYDGKGQCPVNSPQDVRKAFERFGKTDCILEKRVPIVKELSIVAARGADGRTVSYPVIENKHQNGILSASILPARIDSRTAESAGRHARAIIDALDYRGVLCIEFFLLADGSLLVNELAPRPHNSAHATIDAALTSQYEQQVRTMTGLPLGNTSLHCCAVMLNLLGQTWLDDKHHKQTPDWKALLNIDGIKLHLYGKNQVRPGRKMGHITALGRTIDQAMTRAQKVARILNLPIPE